MSNANFYVECNASHVAFDINRQSNIICIKLECAKCFRHCSTFRHFSGRMRPKAVPHRIRHAKNTILFAEPRDFLPCRIKSNLVIFDFFQYLSNRVEFRQTQCETLA